MNVIDWIALVLTLVSVLVYGVVKGRKPKSASSYLLADNSLPWYMVLLGIMATQASAVTFISAPGQAFSDGMRFVQYYFGLPLAMIVICISFIPVFQRLKVYTAYEYLEIRFNKNTRYFVAFLFLLSRAFSTGISIYAPSIILSGILGLNIYMTTIITGGVLIIYTCLGGARAVAHTQKFQLIIILSMVALAGVLAIQALPDGLGFKDALLIAGKSEKLNIITTSFDWKDKYNIWSGLIGGFFLALSYFGTDQSQVGRYLSAENAKSARLGLLMNGLIKIPMQFGILLIGALLFSLYTFRAMPLSFNEQALELMTEQQPQDMKILKGEYGQLQQRYQQDAKLLAHQRQQGANIEEATRRFNKSREEIELKRSEFNALLKTHRIQTDKTDVNYIFLSFVKDNLPIGLVGLLFAAIFLASWGSISAALNSMTSSSLMDFHLSFSKSSDPDKYVWYARIHTLIWGIFSVAMAMLATKMGSLIEAVNVLGSLFYGTILGVFLVAFYVNRVKGNAVLVAAVLTEILILLIYKSDLVSFLWLNVIGALSVPLLAYLFSFILQSTHTNDTKRRDSEQLS